MQFWIINSLLEEKSEKSTKLGLRELLPIEVMPDLQDLAICMMLDETFRGAMDIYNNIEIDLVHKFLAIKNAINYYDEDGKDDVNE